MVIGHADRPLSGKQIMVDYGINIRNGMQCERWLAKSSKWQHHGS